MLTNSFCFFQHLSKHNVDATLTTEKNSTENIHS